MDGPGQTQKDKMKQKDMSVRKRLVRKREAGQGGERWEGGSEINQNAFDINMKLSKINLINKKRQKFSNEMDEVT